MYPHERSLVKKLSGKPFVLLGINSDRDREALKTILKKERITWRSWWDMNIDGPIHSTYQVLERPAIFLLDRKGTIRYKNVQPEELDAAIDALMAEVARDEK